MADGVADADVLGVGVDDVVALGDDADMGALGDGKVLGCPARAAARLPMSRTIVSTSAPLAAATPLAILTPLARIKMATPMAVATPSLAHQASSTICPAVNATARVMRMIATCGQRRRGTIIPATRRGRGSITFSAPAIQSIASRYSNTSSPSRGLGSRYLQGHRCGFGHLSFDGQDRVRMYKVCSQS